MQPHRRGAGNILRKCLASIADPDQPSFTASNAVVQNPVDHVKVGVRRRPRLSMWHPDLHQRGEPKYQELGICDTALLGSAVLIVGACIFVRIHTSFTQIANDMIAYLVPWFMNLTRSQETDFKGMVERM